MKEINKVLHLPPECFNSYTEFVKYNYIGTTRFRNVYLQPHIDSHLLIVFDKAKWQKSYGNARVVVLDRQSPGWGYTWLSYILEGNTLTYQLLLKNYSAGTASKTSITVDDIDMVDIHPDGIYVNSIVNTNGMYIIQCEGSTKEQIRKFIKDIPATPKSKTIPLGTKYLSYLTAEDIKIATDKGWTLA